MMGKKVKIAQGALDTLFSCRKCSRQSGPDLTLIADFSTPLAEDVFLLDNDTSLK